MGNKRSFSDPYSNFLIVGDVSDSEAVTAAFMPGRIGLQSLPAYLHELTHHSCFRGPVGTSLMLLRLRSFDEVLKIRDHNELDVGATYLVECVARYRAVVEILRPLSEGIALFAEHDAFPGHLPVMSHLMSFIGIHFGRIQDDTITVAELASQAIATARNTEFSVNRKENLLSQPIAGPYLSGYLAVKCIQKLFLIHNQIVDSTDSEVLLNFLITHFFYDYELASELLRLDTRIKEDGLSSINRIMYRYQCLWAELLEITSEDYKKFVSSWESNTTEEYITYRCPGQREALQEHINSWGLWIEGNREDPIDSKIIKHIADVLMEHRSKIHVGHFEGIAEVKSGRLTVNPDEMERQISEPDGRRERITFIVECTEDIEDCRKPATFEVVTDLEKRYLVLIVRIDGKLATMISASEKFDQEERKSLEEIAMSLREYQRVQDALEKLTEEIMSDRVEQLEVEELVEFAQRVSCEITLQRALVGLSVADEDIEKIRRDTGDLGFFELFGKDLDTLNKAANLSLITSFSRFKSTQSALLADDGIDADELLVTLRSIEAKWGVSLFVEIDELIFTTF